MFQQSGTQVDSPCVDGHHSQPAWKLEKTLSQEEIQATWPSTQEDKKHEKSTHKVRSQSQDSETKKEGHVQSSP